MKGPVRSQLLLRRTRTDCTQVAAQHPVRALRMAGHTTSRAQAAISNRATALRAGDAKFHVVPQSFRERQSASKPYPSWLEHTLNKTIKAGRDK